MSLPKPYYDDGAGVVIYRGDCREILPHLPKVDLVLTDPPYNAINRETGGLRSLDKGIADSAPVDIPTMAVEFMRLSNGSIYVWCSGEQYTEWLLAFRGAGLTTRNCAWWKTNPSPMNGESLWLSAMELCVFARRPLATFNRMCAHPVWRGAVAESTGHPTPKPLWLISELLRASTNAGDSVLDAYMGGGTTLVAAKRFGRRAIGIEIEEKYCEIAARRVEAERLTLFEAPPEQLGLMV